MYGYRSTTLLLLALTLAACATAPTHDMAPSEQAQLAIQGGDTKRAEEVLKEALAENPDNPYALTDLARLYIGQARYDVARPLSERVVAHESDYRAQADSAETERLVQVARDQLTQISRGEAEEQELLALGPGGAPRAQPLTREATPVPVALQSAAAAPVAATTDGATVAAAAPVERDPETAAKPAPSVEPAAKAPAAPAPSAAAATAVASSPAAPFRYSVQLGAFRSRAGAEQTSARLAKKQQEMVREKEILLTEADGLTKVQVGPYASLREASTACRTLARAGFRCFPRAQ